VSLSDTASGGKILINCACLEREKEHRRSGYVLINHRKRSYSEGIHMISKNLQGVGLLPFITLAVIASFISPADAKGGAGAGGVKAGGASAAGGIGMVPASGAQGGVAGANNARGGRGLSGRKELRGFNHGYGYGYGGGLGVLNQSDGMNINPAPIGQALDAYNEKQDDRRAKLTPAATVKTYARKRTK
jgi:hypothetical protein